MTKYKSVFLESHNIKNLHFGFGQFNHHLIKGLYNANIDDLKFTLHAKNKAFLQELYGPYFKYKRYYSLRRYSLFRITKKYDLWHSMNQNTKIEPFRDIPYLLTVHDVNFVEEDGENKDRFKRFKEKLNRSHAITYISEYAKFSTHQHFEVPDVPEYVIHNGNPITSIDIPIDYRPKLLSKRPYLFSIGEFTERKNFHTLVEMLQHLPDFDLILSGNNDTEYANGKLKQTIEELGLKNRVIVTGKVSDLDKQYYLQHCEGFVFPSLREGFGIPPIEAMRFGKPVFLSNKTSLPEIGGEHAFYWNHYDSEYMAKTLIEGMHSYENDKSNFQQVYIKRAKSFNWDVAAKAYIEVYNKTLNKPWD